jgi:hypothetical protein
MKRFVFLAILLLVFICSSLNADQILLKNGFSGYAGTTDTYIDEDNELANYGSLWYMQVYMQSSNSDEACLVRFDLSGKIPANAQINSATLSLWVNELTDITSSDVIQVGPYRIRQFKDWNETQANWTYFKGSSLWASGGCENTSFDRLASPDSSLYFTNTSQINRYYNWDVTASVSAWYGGEQNNGWLLRAVNHDGGTDGIKMNTKDGGSDYRPYLIINYDIIPEPASICLFAAAMAIFRKRTA